MSIPAIHVQKPLFAHAWDIPCKIFRFTYCRLRFFISPDNFILAWIFILPTQEAKDKALAGSKAGARSSNIHVCM